MGDKIETAGKVIDLMAALKSSLNAHPESAMAREAPRMATDKERLDWLERMANKPGGLLLHDGSERGRLGLGLRPGSLVRSLREAIDAALSTSAEGGKADA